MSEGDKTYEEKLKKTIQIHFKQLKNGCSNKVCYNTHNCRNAYNFSNNSLLKLTDKELLMCSLKKAKQNDDINSLVCYNLSKYQYKSQIVDSITDWFSLLNNSSQIFDPSKVPNLHKESINEIIEIDKIDEIKEINEFNNSLKEILKNCFPELVENNKHESVDCSVLPVEQRISLLELLLKINFNFINYLLLTNKLNYTYTYFQSTSDLFENFLKLANHFKNLNQIELDIHENSFILNLFKGYIEIPKNSVNINIDPQINNFADSLEHLQNFLTVLILDYTGEDVLPTKSELKLLAGLMRLFEIFYYSNLKFDFVKKNLFENEKVNDHLSIKSQLKTYFEYHHNKKIESLHILDVEIEHFSFIKYYYIYNTASKKEIISEYNICLQEKEIKMGFQNLDILFGGGALTLNIKVHRNNLIKSTLDLIIGNLNFRKPLKIKFEGEQGIDEGGVKKEYFMLLMRQLFDPNYYMFTYNDTIRLFWFNLFSFESELKYEMIGILFGLAIYNDVLIDIRFPRVFYKKILDEKLDLSDLEDIDPQMHKNLLYILNYKENDLEDTLGLCFEVEVENFGEIHAIELKEGGKHILINQDNKREYVDLYIDWKFNKSIENFFKALYKGFYRVADKTIFKMIDSKELELIICGKEDYNFDELEKGSLCSDGYNIDSLTVKHFWEVVKEFDDNLKKKFLFFLSGCDRAPVKGLINLRLIIGRQGPDSDKLPTAHTCFNYLLLPDYQNKEKLKKLLLISIENSEGFGLM